MCVGDMFACTSVNKCMYTCTPFPCVNLIPGITLGSSIAQ